MNNNKGFTLTEVLLAAMIVGLLGVALAALTTAAVRESNVGRARVTLRNQLSVALRQLRQDVQASTSANANGTDLTLTQEYALGPLHTPKEIKYTSVGVNGSNCSGRINRGDKIWLNHVKSVGTGGFSSMVLTDSGGFVNSVLRVKLLVCLDTKPVTTEIVDETFVLPQGFGSSHTSDAE